MFNWDYNLHKKHFQQFAKNGCYRHRKKTEKWLKAQGLSIDGYDDTDHAKAIDLAKLWVREKNCCQWCNKKLPIEEAQFDHQISIDKYGSNSIDNIALCCAKCNKHKATKHPAQFSAEQKVKGISTLLIETYLEQYKNDPGVQQILSQDFLLP